MTVGTKSTHIYDDNDDDDDGDDDGDDDVNDVEKKKRSRCAEEKRLLINMLARRSCLSVHGFTTSHLLQELSSSGRKEAMCINTVAGRSCYPAPWTTRQALRWCASSARMACRMSFSIKSLNQGSPESSQWAIQHAPR